MTTRVLITLHIKDAKENESLKFLNKLTEWLDKELKPENSYRIEATSGSIFNFQIEG